MREREHLKYCASPVHSRDETRTSLPTLSRHVRAGDQIWLKKPRTAEIVRHRNFTRTYLDPSAHKCSVLPMQSCLFLFTPEPHQARNTSFPHAMPPRLVHRSSPAQDHPRLTSLRVERVVKSMAPCRTCRKLFPRAGSSSASQQCLGMIWEPMIPLRSRGDLS